MKLFRAIEFSKLIFLIDGVAIEQWEAFNEENMADPKKKDHNWWLTGKKKANRRKIISSIFDTSEDKFFSQSLEYNAMQGGRFNPSRSFGVLYTASSPLVSALEVLYHIFMETHPLYLQMNRNGQRITSSFNIAIPRRMYSLIIAFEIEIDKPKSIVSISDSIETLKGKCVDIGFDRYIGTDFSRDFIFGNDYEISRILGCHLHSHTNPCFKVQSARIDFDHQLEAGIHNIIIPEKEMKTHKPRLTGNYMEFLFEADMESSGKHHQINVEVLGKETTSFGMFLQNIPNKKYGKDQYIEFRPNIADKNKQRHYSREVEIQKYAHVDVAI